MNNLNDYMIEIVHKSKHNLQCIIALEDFCFTRDKTTPQGYQKLFRKKNTVIFGVRFKDELIASAVLIRNVGAYRLYSLGVLPAHREIGVGNALLETIEKYCAKRQVTRLLLETRSDNLNALILYKSRGYRIFGTYEHFYEDGGHAIRLTKKFKEQE